MKINQLMKMLLAFGMGISIAGCSREEPQPGEEPVPTEEASKETDEDTRIKEIIASMTPQQKLAQMLIVALRSDPNNTRTPTAIDENYAELLSRYDFGGILLMGGSIQDTAQTVTMIRDIQKAALNSDAGIPMFISLDEEGGMVNRVSYGTTGPGNMALAAMGDVNVTEECANILGEEIAALGFNMDFAPVADVNSNPNNPIIGVRSFSDDPAVVSEQVKAFVKGLKNHNIASALKHFPGHGNVGEDSHTHLPCSDFSLEEIEKMDLIPFESGIEEEAEMIMTAHIQYPQIEKETYISIQDGKEITLPATLSRTIIHDLLREKMGYDGVVITDAMVMEAIASHFDLYDASVMAVNADVDILLAPVDVYQDDEIDTFGNLETYMQGMMERIEAGEITEEELDNSVYRILKLKMEKGILDYDLSASVDDMIAKAESAVGTAEHHAWEWQMTQSALTLLKNDSNALPVNGMDGQNTLILCPGARRRPAVDYAIRRLEKEGLLDSASVNVIDYSTLSAEDPAIQEALADAQRVLILSQSVYRNNEVVKIIDQAHAEGKTASLISLNLPYDAACYENADAVLCAYNPYGSAHDEEGNGPFNLNVACAVCAAFNECVPKGHLPVNVPKIDAAAEDTVFIDELLYERGEGLENWGQ